MSRFVFGSPKSDKIKLKANMMSKAEDIFDSKPEQDGYIYANAEKTPFVIGGISRPEDNCGEYYRLDATKKDIYSEQNRNLARCNPGASVRFTTDETELAIRVTLNYAILGMHHFCDRGVYGIDAYCGTGTDRRYVGRMMQTFADTTSVNQGTIPLPEGIKEVMINLPLYGGIEKIEFGFCPQSNVGSPSSRAYAPIAFYGSSITQGGCVSRPGNSYCNIICRALNTDCRNFGFSGSAMGETSVAEYIASCELSCFVMDYDYNSPSVEHLSSTHEAFFKIIRNAQPKLPVVFVTHPFYSEPTENDLARISVVRATYDNAVAAGDKNVYFVDSRCFFTPEMRDLYAVDNLHPNDLGQMSMAECIFPSVKKALSVK